MDGNNYNVTESGTTEPMFDIDDWIKQIMPDDIHSAGNYFGVEEMLSNVASSSVNTLTNKDMSIDQGVSENAAPKVIEQELIQFPPQQQALQKEAVKQELIQVPPQQQALQLDTWQRLNMYNNQPSNNVCQSSGSLSDIFLQTRTELPNKPTHHPIAESTSRNELQNDTEWYDQAYQQLQSMKWMYFTELIQHYKATQERSLQASTAEMTIKYNKRKQFVEKAVKLLRMPKSDFVQLSKEKVQNYMDIVERYMYQVRTHNQPQQKVSSPRYNLTNPSHRSSMPEINRNRLDMGRANLVTPPRASSSPSLRNVLTGFQSIKQPFNPPLLRIKDNSQYLKKIVTTSSSQSASRSIQHLGLKDLSSLFIIPSPSPLTPLTPSSMQVDCDKSSPLTLTQNVLATDLVKSVNSQENQELHSKEENPHARLIQVIKQSSLETLRASVHEIGAVINSVDNYTSGEDLADINASEKRMKRSFSISASDSFEESHFKLTKINKNIDLLSQQVKESNKYLVETSVDVVSTADEGTIVRFSYVALGEFATTHMKFPKLVMRLLVTTEYPNCSPRVLDVTPHGSSENEEAKSVCDKVMSKFSLSLRNLSDPIAVGEMAKAWDTCAREVFREYAKLLGGECFSSRYQTWESCAVKS